MAQRVQIQMLDDINGEEAQETVRFGLDGVAYEIDLTTDNAGALRSALAQYVDVARKASNGRKGRGSQPGASSNQAKREEMQRIRQWAQDNGHSASARGRISQWIVDAYREAQK